MVELQPVDAVEVTLVVDNFVDILLDRRPHRPGGWAVRPRPLHRLATALPESFIQPSVGTVVRF